MKRSRSTARILLIGLLMLVALSGLVFRLWYVQIARGADYTARIGNRSAPRRTSPSPATT